MKTRFGDIIQIRTSKGLAYALYTHRHEKPPRYGAVIRVFDRIYEKRPRNIAEIPALPVRFTTFFPLQAAVDKGIVEVIGNAPVPEVLRPFPIFRDGMINPKTKRVDTWWLWDGEREWKVGEINSEQRKLPLRAIWNDTYLIHRIEEGWRPETDAQ